MGQEIGNSHFSASDFQEFAARLRQETDILKSWFDQQSLATESAIAGFELEAWLVDAEGRPAPINQLYLKRLNDPLVVPELSVFNVEFNTPEQRLQGDVFSRLHKALDDLWQRSDQIARELGARLAMIGTLPTLHEQDLSLASMSSMRRYKALNEQVLRMRQGTPLQLDICGPQALRTEHYDVMLEAATTAFQLHLQVPQEQAPACFNAIVMLSAPLLAATTNSPYLFDKELWEETRIPLFEQAVAVGGDLQGDDPAYRRVTFGSGYLQQSMLELFLENLQHYPPLLPMCMDEAPNRLCHLRLHNGTIWRWNRPLVGFNHDGIPHVRIEHRVMPAGPTIADTIANAALFYGLVQAFAHDASERQLPFVVSRNNFYTAAQYGLKAELVWRGEQSVPVRQLLLQELLPLARQGLEDLGIDSTDCDTYLGIIAARIDSGRTGSRWQRDFVACHGPDMQTLTLAYLERQASGIPVHEWELAP